MLAFPLFADAAPVTAPADAPPAPPTDTVDHVPPHSVPLHPWVIFDPHLARREIYVWGGPVHERPADGSPASDGVAAGLGWSLETRRSVFLLRGTLQYGIRGTGNGHFVPTLAQYTYGAGLALGPVEITASAGLVALELHFGHDGFGVGGLSPRADVGASITLGRLRIGAHLFSEYSWRWTSGGPSAFVRGAVFELALGGKPPLPDMYRVEGGPEY